MNPLQANTAIDASGHEFGTGWMPPIPDLRDWDEQKDEILAMSSQLGLPPASETDRGLGSAIDLRRWCSPIEDQGSLGSCTANAAAGVIEYFERRAFGHHLDASRLFIYKATRNLMGVTGDSGAWLRNTMGALALLGAPPEKLWPYSDSAAVFDREPTAFVYGVADNFEALRYFRHDPDVIGRSRTAVLNCVKRFLSAGIPSMFGFFGFSSFSATTRAGDIPFPCSGEAVAWGHAVVAVGYDDNRVIENTINHQTTTGALLIRNSWGPSWGDAGYGYLPYEYARKGLALDFWSLLRLKWVETKQFGFSMQDAAQEST